MTESVTNPTLDLVTHGEPEEPLGWLPLEVDSPEEGYPRPQVLVPEGVDPREEPDDGEVEDCVTNPGALVTHPEDPLDHPDMLPFREPPVPEDPEDEEEDEACAHFRVKGALPVFLPFPSFFDFTIIGSRGGDYWARR